MGKKTILKNGCDLSPALYLFTTTTPRTVVVNAIAASSRPTSLNFRAIDAVQLIFFKRDIIHI